MTHYSNLPPKMILDLTSLDGIWGFIRYDGEKFCAGRMISRFIVRDGARRGARLIPIISQSSTEEVLEACSRNMQSISRSLWVCAVLSLEVASSRQRAKLSIKLA